MPFPDACSVISELNVNATGFDALRNRILELAAEQSGGELGPEAISLALIAYDRPRGGRNAEAPAGRFGYRDDTPVYPASIVKLFCLYAFTAFEAMERFCPDEEDRRAARAMIELSSNEATAYLMGRLTGAFDGSCLSEADLVDWLCDRHAIQDWLSGLGEADFHDINVLHATYEDSPYGSAYQARARSQANRLTARACAALMRDIVQGTVPSSGWMMELMDRTAQRRALADTGHPVEGDQVRGFLGEAMPASTRLWSKAGHTSWTRHDLVYAETACGRSFIACVMTDSRWSAADTTFFPQVGRLIHEALGEGGKHPT